MLDHQIARAQIRDGRPGFHHFAQRFVPEHETIRSGRRRAIRKGADVLVGAANAYFQHAQLHLGGRGDARFDDVDDIDGALGGIDSYGLHGYPTMVAVPLWQVNCCRSACQRFEAGWKAGCGLDWPQLCMIVQDCAGLCIGGAF